MRLINLLRDLLVGICPALKRAFSYPPQRPGRHADAVARPKPLRLPDPNRSHPGEARATKLVCDLAHQSPALDERISYDKIRETFRVDDGANTTGACGTSSTRPRRPR